MSEMTRKQKFGDSFWGTDFCSSAGLDALVKRLREGRSACKEIEEFFKQRSKAEDDYARALSRIAKSNCGANEIGTMKKALDCLKQQTEAMATEHQKRSNFLLERAKQMGVYGEKYKTNRKMHEETVRKDLKKKVELYRSNTQKKKDYDTKCMEFDKAVQSLQQAKAGGNNTDKSYTFPQIAAAKTTLKPEQVAALIKSAQAQETKAKSNMERADQSYQETNASLEQTRLIWEKNMASLCESYEELEIQRFEYIRNELWSYTNAISTICVNVDEQCETIRKSIEICDIDQDLSEFITQKGTGSTRPSQVPYRKYGEQDTVQIGPAIRKPGRPPPVPPDHPHR